MSMVTALAVAILAQQMEDPFKGYAEGTWVKNLMTLTVEGQTERRIESKHVQGADGELSLVPYVEGKEGEPVKVTMLWWTPSTAKFEKASSKEDEVDVAGRMLKCAHEVWKGKRGESEIEVEVWRGDGAAVPSRVLEMPGADPLIEAGTLKWRMSLTQNGEKTDAAAKVVKLSEPLTIGDREVSAVVEELTLSSKDQSGTGTRWLSTEVLGHVLKVDLQGQAGEAKARRLMVVTAFETKKK
jgi:hypothetical protein